MEDDVDLDVSSERLADEVTTLAGHIAAATYRLLRLIGELDRRGVWADWGCRSCSHWLNWQIGLDVRTAREHVRVAHRLDELPVVAAAFRAGTISYSKVRALCRIASPATEADLVTLARNGTAAHIERIARAYRRTLALSLDDAERQHASRSARWWWDDDGSLVFTTRLPAETGALLQKAIVETMTASREPYDERAADAFVDIIQRALPAGARRYQVLVHVDTATLAGGDGRCHLDGGPALAGETARRIACDTTATTVTDGGADTVTVGRRSRTVPASLRRALHRRDGGCRFPGCTSRRYTDGHHIKHWARGGPTSLANLILLCRHRHRLLHEGGWRLHTDGTGAHFYDPNGRELAPGPPNPSGDPRAVRHPRVDADTIRSDWAGEPLHLDLIVEDLYHQDNQPAPRNRILLD
jgi:hypothetical protein